jgi:hypothetical protein
LRKNIQARRLNPKLTVLNIFKDRAAKGSSVMGCRQKRKLEHNPGTPPSKCQLNLIILSLFRCL